MRRAAAGLLLGFVGCLGVFALAAPATPAESSCAEQALGPVTVIEAAMRHPGDHYSQSLVAEFAAREMSAACREGFVLVRPRYQFQLQDHLRHSRWIGLNPFRPVGFSQLHNDRPFAARWGIQRGHGLLKPIARERLYQCSPGKAVTKVRVELRLAVVDRENASVAAKKTVFLPIEVRPVRAAIKHRGALRGPC